MKRNILLSIALLGIFILPLQGQDRMQKILEDNLNRGLLSNEEFFEKAELVVEGRVIQTFGAYDAKGNLNPDDIYTLQAFWIQRVYKGDQKWTNDTLYVIRHWGRIYIRKTEESGNGIITYTKAIPPEYHGFDFADHGVSLDKNYSDILFFIKSDYPENPAKSQYSDKPKYQFLQDKEKATLKFGSRSWGDNGRWGKITGLNNLIFNNRKEFYDYMKQFEGYMVPELPAVVPDKPQREYKTPETPLLDSATQKIIDTKWGGDKKKALKSSAKSIESALTLKLANQHVVYNDSLDKYYVKFDVLARSSPSLYFDGAKMNIRYDTTLFGSNIKNSGKLNLSFADNFNNGNDYKTYTFYDMTPNGIDLIFGVNITHQNRVLLTGDFTPLLHFQVELLPNINSAQSQLLFFNTAYTATASTYALTSNASFIDYNDYDHTFYINSDTVISVPASTKPVITTNLSALSKTAGIGDTLTIRGLHFGPDKGSVHFTCPDKGGMADGKVDFLLDLEDQYYIHWSDTLIKVLVPSLVYKGYENEDKNWRGGAGTGPIKIKTAAGDSCISATSLYIPVSVLNIRDTVGRPIRKPYLATKDCEFDFQFTLHRQYQYDAQKIALIDTALKHWSALTGLTLILERNAAGNLIFADTEEVDGKTVISPFNDVSNRLMFTEVAYVRYIENTDTMFICSKGSNIRINHHPSISSSWSYAIAGTVPAGQYSFYQTFMHELGHFLLLEHVIAPTQLMHYNVNPGHAIITLSASDMSVIAVNNIIEASQSLNWTSHYRLIVPAKPVISVLSPGQSVICNGQPITLSSSYPADNTWSTGAVTPTIQVSTQDVYWVFYRVGFCSYKSNPITVTASNANATFSVNHVVCRNTNTGSINTLPSGTHPPYSYQWTGNGLTPTATQNLDNVSAGQYALRISNNTGCAKNYTVMVTEPNPLDVWFTLSASMPSMIVAEGSGGTPPYSYQWSYNGASPFLKCMYMGTYANASSIPLSYNTKSCILQLTVTDMCGEQVFISQVVPKRMLLNSEKEIVLFPNPTSDSFAVSNITDADIQLYSSTGSYIKTFNHVTSEETLDVSNLSAGVYLLKIMEDNATVNKKLVVSN